MPISSLSRQARQILATHPRLEVHSVFRASVNLRADGRLITCTADAVRAPHGVEMAPADLAGLHRLGSARPSAELRWHAPTLTLISEGGDLVIPAIPQPREFDPTIPLVNSDGVRGQLPPLIDLLARTKPATGLGDQWLTLTTDARLTRAVTSVLDYAVDAPLLHWIGRGPGLTPSGDDFLVGAIAALWCVGAITAQPLSRMGARLEAAAGRQTTDISVEYLHYACRGMATGLLCDLLTALGSADSSAVLAAVGQLRRYGHTSGMDCLLGAVTALRELNV
ncbi:MAG: DUF2877 domain-containing protein [Trebonia sp.]